MYSEKKHGLNKNPQVPYEKGFAEQTVLERRGLGDTEKCISLQTQTSWHLLW